MGIALIRGGPEHYPVRKGAAYPMTTSMPSYPTKNTLPEKVRANSIEFLQENLSCAIDLMLQCKQAHWNIKGENFIGLHKLFDKVHHHSSKWVDEIAERIVQLGGVAEGTAQAVIDRTELPEYPIDVTDEVEHIELLSRSLASFGEYVREGIDQTDELGDPITCDMLTRIGGKVDESLWMVEAHHPGKTTKVSAGGHRAA